MLFTNIIIPFVGTHAGIPANFSRETSLDGLFPKSTVATPNVTGGNPTHTHTSPAHSHTLNDHTHTYTLPATTLGNANDNQANVGAFTSILRNDHSHTGTSGSSSGGTTSTTAVTYGAASNSPPYYEVIFIKSLSQQNVPINGVVLSNNTIHPHLAFHGASAGKYLRGAGTGADAGGTGGSYTNSHDITHTHSVNTHTHTAASSGGPQGHDIRDGENNTPFDSINTGHTHSVSLNANSQAINQNADTLVTAESVEPAYKTLNAYYNNTAGALPTAVDDIALWLGSLASIPPGWFLCDGNNGTQNMSDKFLKLNASASSSTTGGSNIHTHAAQSHSHTSNGTHTHNIDQQSHSATAKRLGNGLPPARLDNVHAGTTSDAIQATYASATTTADSSNNEPSYRTVAYIQFKFDVGGAALLGLL